MPEPWSALMELCRTRNAVPRSIDEAVSWLAPYIATAAELQAHEAQAEATYQAMVSAQPPIEHGG